MFTALEVVPRQELEARWASCRAALDEHLPGTAGMMVFSRLAVYYLSGTMASGVFWLPLEGEPVLLLRRGLERAGLESEVANILRFRSFADVPRLANDAGSPLTGRMAAEMGGLTWALGLSLQKRLPDYEFVPGDQILARVRGVKSPWELERLRECGARHHECLHDLLPARVRPGMNEREISHLVWEVFFSRGHCGILRMQNHGEEIFLGHVSAGDSGNYPSHFNGPLGLRGEHPAATFMGNADKVWERGEPLALDVGFGFKGYCTDKTQLLFGGPSAGIPPEAAAAHSFCVDVQAWVAEHLTPGAVPSRIFDQAMAWAGKAGFAEGFMGLGGNKVAFLGHGIGLAIDEYPVLAKGFDTPLEAGTVLAVEPKLGIPGLGMVGVENTFEVTPHGGVCLTGDEYSMIPVD